MRLTPKQSLFVREYLVDLNATRAAIRAGYSERSAYSTGQENLKKPVIKKELARCQKERFQRLGIDADYVLRMAVEAYDGVQRKVRSKCS